MVATQASEEKRAQILRAVLKVLARKGYIGTTISEVAAESRVSRGLLHYYFQSKEDMVAQAARHNLQQGLSAMAQGFQRSQSAQDLARNMSAGLRQLLRQRPDFFNVYFEGWALTRQSEIIYQEYARLYQEFRQAVQDNLAAAAARGLISPALPLPSLAAMITALLDGLGLQLMTEPELLDQDELWSDLEKAIQEWLGS